MLIPSDKNWDWLETNLDIKILKKTDFIDLGGYIPNDRKNHI